MWKEEVVPCGNIIVLVKKYDEERNQISYCENHPDSKIVSNIGGPKISKAHTIPDKVKEYSPIEN